MAVAVCIFVLFLDFKKGALMTSTCSQVNYPACTTNKMSLFTTLTVSSLLALRQTPTDPKALARLVGDAFFKESTPPKGPSKPGAAPAGFKVYESNVSVPFCIPSFAHSITLENTGNQTRGCLLVSFSLPTSTYKCTGR